MNGASGNLGQTVSTLTRVLVAPASNLRVAILLYATIGVFLLLLLVIGVMIIMSAPEDEEVENVLPEEGEDEPGSPEVGEDEPILPEEGEEDRTKRRPPPMGPKARLLLVLTITVVLAGVWLAAGYTTSDPALCKSCHWSTSQHAKADTASNPHRGVGCVACHESGGVFGRYVSGLPFRMVHLAMASDGRGNASDYGMVTSRACSGCHAASLPGTSTNAKRGLKMSHSEPLDAAARCVDCHTLQGGIVGAHNAGMKPCLRCHDGGKVASACPTCHVGKASAATRVRTTSFRSKQIQEVSCSGCHDEARTCDPCHGTRMPHSAAFMAGAHARAGVVDIWYNGGKACGRCHTATRRPCGRCHTNLLGKAHGPSMSASHQSSTTSRCNTCHLKFASVATRDFCKDLCHSEAAEDASPR